MAKKTITAKKKPSKKPSKKQTKKSPKTLKTKKKQSRKMKSSQSKPKKSFFNSIIFSMKSKPREDTLDLLKNDEKIINNEIEDKPKVVLIHAEWCGHCKRLMPDWKTMKGELMTNHKMTEDDFYEIESEETHEKLPELNKYVHVGEPIQADGYPTIGKIQKGEFIKYGDERTVENLKKFFTTI